MRVSRSYQIREAMLPGPAQSSGYRTVVLVGPTGSGKTTLIRQLIGVEGPEDRFPAVSAAKTTVAETEVLSAPGDYYAVATFRPREEVRLLVAECLLAALGALADGRPDAEVERALLVHHQQRFQLRYLLGPAEGTGLVDLRGGCWIGEVLDGLHRLLATHHGPRCTSDRLWAAPAFTAVVDEVVEELRRRVERLPAGTLRREADGWPATWHVAEHDREALVDLLGFFAGNDSRRYGRLVTPLVDGLRVRGPFRPLGVAEVPYLLVVDTEGLGHTPASAGGMPPGLVEACFRADWVVLVDSAAQPMQAATTSALRQLVGAGQTDKLLLAFTHVDRLHGPNLRSAGARRDFLRSCRDQTVEHLTADGLDDATRRELVNRLDEHTYFFGEQPGLAGAEPPTGRRRPAVAERASVRRGADPQLGPLIRALRAEALPASPRSTAHTCRREELADAVDDAVVGFRHDWLDAVRAGRASRRRHGAPGARRGEAGGRRGRRSAAAGHAAEELAAAVVDAVRQLVGAGGRGSSSWRDRPVDRFARAATGLVTEAAERWVGELTSVDWAGIAQLSDADAEHAALARLLDRQLGLDWGQGFLAEAFAAVEHCLSAAGYVIVDGGAAPMPRNVPVR